METTEALRLFDDVDAEVTAVSAMAGLRKVDLSSSTSIIPVTTSLLAAVYGTVGPFIVTFGLVGNILILVVVSRSAMNGAIPVYLSALALSDIGALLTSIPLWIRHSNGFSCSFSNAFYYAHFELMILNTFMAASIFNVVALTLERYTSVCWPGQFPSMHTPRRARRAVGFAYVLALIISLPLSVMKHVKQHYQEETAAGGDGGQDSNISGGVCAYEFMENTDVTEHWRWTAYVWCGEILVRFVPASILASLNWRIMMKFRGVVKTRLQLHAGTRKQSSSDHQLASTTQHATGRHLEEERKLLTLLTSIIILFFVTNIPSAVLSIIYSQDLEDRFSFQIFRAVANLLEMSNFALNFCMYFLCSREFRKMLFLAIPIRWPECFELWGRSSSLPGSTRTSIPNTVDHSVCVCQPTAV